MNTKTVKFWDTWKNFNSAQSKSDKSYLLTVFPPNYFDYFIDIGAQHGWLAVEVAKRNPLTKILSFEPVQSEYEALVKKTKGYNIQTFNIALGDGSPLYFKRKGSGWHMFVKEDTGKYQTQSLTLSDIFKQNNINPHQKKVFLKMDCEGGERFLLNDLESIELMKTCIHTGMEIHFTASCVNSVSFRYYKFPDFAIYVDWIKKHFNDSHHIIYHKSRRTSGLGTYVLTRKDTIV